MSGRDIVPADRLEAIRELRVSDPDRYYSPAIQSEEIALIDAKNAPVAKALAAIEALKQGLDWSTMFATFDSLPSAVVEAVGAELLSGLPVWPPAPSWEEIQSFKRTDAGRLCAREWGDQAGQKLATIRARVWRIISALDDDDAVAALNWVDELEVDEAAAVLRAAGGNCVMPDDPPKRSRSMERRQKVSRPPAAPSQSRVRFRRPGDARRLYPTADSLDETRPGG